MVLGGTGSAEGGTGWYMVVFGQYGPGAESRNLGKSQLLLLGKFEYTGGPIFKVVLEC